ncbi:uncharacterized protein LOC131612928 [Vicia villosa]|uniref:uncharacterized protein LOC131612928 n=1 Tax=Vicia villosa TaxID=3911 RepID=UPI00273B5632|nr:uncharacterized protein LOC131612928 [Vicia villosa]
MDSSSSSSSSLMVSFPFALTIKNLLPSNENSQEFCYLQNGGGLGVAALMENADSFLDTLPSDPTFLSAIFALFVTQSTKVFLNFFEKGQWNFRLMFASQGIPSTRSTLCSAITTSLALSHGVADSFFPVSLGFTLIVMCDSVFAKRHVDHQARVINTVLDHVSGGGTPVPEERLTENAGNTLPQVLTGALLGSTVAVLCFMFLRR